MKQAAYDVVVVVTGTSSVADEISVTTAVRVVVVVLVVEKLSIDVTASGTIVLVELTV